MIEVWRNKSFTGSFVVAVKYGEAVEGWIAYIVADGSTRYYYSQHLNISGYRPSSLDALATVHDVPMILEVLNAVQDTS